MSFDPEDGRQLMREMFGEEFLEENMDRQIKDQGWCSDLAELALKVCFAEVWRRSGLDRRSRSILTLGILIARGTPEEFRRHVIGALGNGLTAEEIQEILIHASIYTGFPAVSHVMGGAAQVLKERGLI